jgi:hypothetical protein
VFCSGAAVCPDQLQSPAHVIDAMRGSCYGLKFVAGRDHLSYSTAADLPGRCYISADMTQYSRRSSRSKSHVTQHARIRWDFFFDSGAGAGCV